MAEIVLDTGKEDILIANGLDTLSAKFYSFDETDEDAPEMHGGAFSTPIFSPFKIPSFNYDNIDGEEIEVEELTILNGLLTVSRRKNIIRTTIAGSERQGTVKELVSQGDREITLRGTLSTSKNRKFPAEQLDRLKQILDAPTSFRVVSPILQKIDIHDVSVLDYSMNQREGFHNLLPININFVEDIPIEIETT